MKINWIIMTLVVGVLAGCSSSPKSVLTGTVNGLADGTEIYLVPGATAKDELPVDAAIVQNGTFKFTGDLPEPRFFYVRVKDYYGGIPVFLENSKITLTADAKLEERDDAKWASFENIEVKGSPTYDLYMEKMKVRDDLNAQHKAYMDRSEDIRSQMTQARKENNQVKLDSLWKTEAGLQLQKDEKEFFDNVKESYRQTFSANKDTWWGPFLMLSIMSYITPEQQPWFEEFSEEAKNSYYGKILRSQVYPKSLVNEPLPAFSLIGDKNESVTFSDLAKGKKYLLIDFWASWCAPCRKEIPNLKELYNTYSAQGFEIISISIDNKEEDWTKALEEEKLPWPNFLDTQGASDVFNVRTIPAMFLVDADGIVISEQIRGEALKTKLAELFQ